MPTKTKPKPKAKLKPAPVEQTVQPPTEEIIEARAAFFMNVSSREGVNDCMENVIRPMVKIYESETGAKANQVRLIDFIRWWEEREKK